ncbi:snf2 family helicase [Colletotrichum truncatum]|uniref:Snf2 family helicase n=1 Tax=Colletotrichum truncatum TaxID=5467 RepID=A0ACC3Z434_COLTU|nr:snf2 family helicase [Colletotrichum truncatum]KAF6795657.1 snf2 family helicase [Colletotrichum truncatum]
MSKPSNYLPIGCLVTSQKQTAIEDVTWKQFQERYESWAYVCPTGQVPDISSTQLAVFDDTDDALLTSPPFKNYRPLAASRWIRLEFMVTGSNAEVGVARIYALPDDIDRRLVDRARSKLKSLRGSLLNLLDCSPETWKGRINSVPISITNHSVKGVDAGDEALSLLQMFNSMPSPDPNPNAIVNQADQEAAYAILASELPGLKTTLYDYQRRSAALMIERESEPGRFLDPRLLKGIDQNGVEFYFDTSSGVLLKEPRYYDGVKGGILAEQMGAGKTLICLSVILATRHSATQTPDIYQGSDILVRKRIASLADMAAASVTRKAAPWKTYFNVYGIKEDLEFPNCLAAIDRNPGFYSVPAPPPRRLRRNATEGEQPPRKIWHSHASLVVVPNNLVQQWEQEISKHTVASEDPASLKVLTLTSHKGEIPSAARLVTYDIVLISQSRLLKIYKETLMHGSTLSEVHFKRCIVDEGHKLGHSKILNKSDLLLALDLMSIAARWIVTGTPSPGLYGVDNEAGTSGVHEDGAALVQDTSAANTEKQDLEKIGAIASLYLNARPWSNTLLETEDTTADWAVYVMQPRHSSRSSGRKGVLRATLNSLLIRHQLSELNNLLPAVNENIVVLEGSYQDKLSLNIFSMMIIFNAVQSQRTDMDYFFHPRQKKALLQLLHNLKQASFFGGSFFAPEDIQKSLDTAKQFLEEKKVAISKDDEVLLEKAMEIARIAIENPLKTLSNFFNEIPVFVRDFLPNDAGAAWSLDEKNTNPSCTDAGMVMAVQKLIRSSLGDPTKLNSLLNGQLLEAGHKEMADQVNSSSEVSQAERRPTRTPCVLAGNTKLGGERTPKHLRANAIHAVNGPPPPTLEPPEDLRKAELVSTVSAKLSYLIDAVAEHQKQEKMIIFYENENVAWYLASLLDVIQVPHLIYAKTLSYERKMQYINTFNHEAEFRVILMDLSQAAVGLDMRAASRIYFINPVLNPQIQAQAIGRARRISQQKPVTVETLVLRGSIEEVIVERKKSMSQIEHWKCKTILDDRPIYNWILNAGIIPLPEDQKDNLAQAIPLKHPQPVFGGGFGREQHPDQDLIMGDVGLGSSVKERQLAVRPPSGLKRSPSPGLQTGSNTTSHPARRVRFTEDGDNAHADVVMNGVSSNAGNPGTDHPENEKMLAEKTEKPLRQVRFA